MWKPEMSDEERVRKRDYFEYSKWREEVFIRDNYTCSICGVRSGNGKAVVLNAHHISSFHADEDNRTNIKNGTTLCAHCHKLFHDKYGYRNNTEEQFLEFSENFNKEKG
jgi:5-methylcytosine-specific restriction endonuclease McrA